jgi:hypothetical protein
MGEGMSMELNKDEVKELFETLFATLAACTVLVGDYEATKTGGDITPALKQSIEALTFVIPNNIAAMAAYLMGKDRSIKLGEVDGDLFIYWVLRTKRELDRVQKDE